MRLGRKLLIGGLAVAVLAAIVITVPTFAATRSTDSGRQSGKAIQHVVVIFQENVSFDHYFALSSRAESGRRAAVSCRSFMPAARRRANAHVPL